MSEGPVRPIRKVGIPDHLWETLEQMAGEMGVERDALVSQAIFTLARLNGYVVPGTTGAMASVTAPSPVPSIAAGPAPVAARAAPPPQRNVIAPPPPPPPPAVQETTPGPSAEDPDDDPGDEIDAAPPPPERTPGPPPERTPGPGAGSRPSVRPPPPVVEERPAPPPPRAAPPPSVSRPPPPPAESRSRPPETPSAAQQRLDDDPARREVAERVLETAAELERLIKGKGDKKPEPIAPPPPPPPPSPADSGVIDEGPGPGEHALYLMAEDGDLDRVAKERFLIGRGKHCDFVINSGKVSREHAVISREGDEYFIEDLGSSNGTWFNKQRIKRRKIEDGDEYYVCSEKLKCVIR